MVLSSFYGIQPYLHAASIVLPSWSNWKQLIINMTPNENSLVYKNIEVIKFLAAFSIVDFDIK